MGRMCSHSSLQVLVLMTLVTMGIILCSTQNVNCAAVNVYAANGAISADSSSESDENGETQNSGMSVTFDTSTRPGVDHQGVLLTKPTDEDWRCPPLPDSIPLVWKICDAKLCYRDEDCGDSQKACCFNGCVHSCTTKMDPPSAFDWLEETDMTFLRNETERSWDPLGFLRPSDSSSSSEEGMSDRIKLGVQPKILLQATGESEVIALPGGCLISLQQYQDLLKFRQNHHVHSCTCSSGDVVCEVNKISV